VKEGFLPLISPDCYCWVDAGNGVMISTSVFEDQAGAPASNRTAADSMRENLASLLPNPPQITAGKVVALKRPKRSGVLDQSGAVELQHDESVFCSQRFGGKICWPVKAWNPSGVIFHSRHRLDVIADDLEICRDQTSCLPLEHYWDDYSL
jgi:hypothetical protein